MKKENIPAMLTTIEKKIKRILRHPTSFPRNLTNVLHPGQKKKEKKERKLGDYQLINL